MKPAPTPLHVAVIGAGPAGLEAALAAASLGHAVTVYEAGAVAAAVERWGFVRLFTPFGQNTSSLGLGTLKRENPRRELPGPSDSLTGREFREAYLLPLAQSELLRDSVRVETRVLAVSRQGWRKSEPCAGKLPPFRLLVRHGNLERLDRADAVIDCGGALARPNWLGDGGIPALGEVGARPHVWHGVDDILGARQAHYAGATVAVVGTGHSAATAVCDLMALAEYHQSTWVVWLARGAATAPLKRVPHDPLKERDRLACRANNFAARGDGNLEYHAHAQIEEIAHLGPAGFRIRLGGAAPQTFNCDRVIAAPGARPDLVPSAELRAGEPAGGEVATGEPGYFFAGAKSFGGAAGYLMRHGIEQAGRLGLGGRGASAP